MKKALTASLLLNLVLATCLFILRPRADTDSRPPATDVSQAQAPEAAASEAAQPTSEAVRSVGEKPPPAEFSQSAQVPKPSGRARMMERPAVMPLAFQDVDLSQLNLNHDQLQAIEDLRQRFTDEIGGLQQDLKDPGYRERWLKSQPQLDDDLRGMIGVTAYQNYQIQAAALAEKHIGP